MKSRELLDEEEYETINQQDFDSIFEKGTRTKFKHLTLPVKIGIVGGWAAIIVWGLVFLIGFIEGLLG